MEELSYQTPRWPPFSVLAANMSTREAGSGSHPGPATTAGVVMAWW
jgi:hypothetical protein